uniref:Uncharacterized protein n=1 Tax=Trichogramma kaykai TaxID=54128 RepID=A0ABD2W703_9HYME
MWKTRKQELSFYLKRSSSHLFIHQPRKETADHGNSHWRSCHLSLVGATSTGSVQIRFTVLVFLYFYSRKLPISEEDCTTPAVDTSEPDRVAALVKESVRDFARFMSGKVRRIYDHLFDCLNNVRGCIEDTNDRVDELQQQVRSLEQRIASY